MATPYESETQMVDFNQVEKTMELYDPETQVAISEQTVKSESGGKTISRFKRCHYAEFDDEL